MAPENSGPAGFNLDQITRLIAAYDKSKAGASIELSVAGSGVSVDELGDLIRICIHSNIDDLSCSIATALGKSHPGDVELVAVWLKETLIFVFEPDADLIAEVAS